MRIIVLGGDGFCGWPTALHLNKDHDVLIVDNLSRRQIAERTGQSLTPIDPLSVRVAGTGIEFSPIDIAFGDPGIVKALFREWKPDCVVHFAEQRSAPYSMKTPETRRYTIANNIGATSNVLNAIVEVDKDIHLVHLGTMGVYGYGGGKQIPDGYVETEFGRHLFPPKPGSVYHTTKVMDAELFQFYNRNWGLKITDLHQGIVWGTQTEDTEEDERFINRFDYDGDYGTVLNRFLAQAAIGYPLTVYGTGGQTRAFIHISDTVKCIKLACESPPDGEVRILNQQAECRSVLELAEIVSGLTGAKVDFLENPRKEAAENDLVVTNEGFRGMGWEPVLLNDSLINEVVDIAGRWAPRINRKLIPPTAKW